MTDGRSRFESAVAPIGEEKSDVGAVHDAVAVEVSAAGFAPLTEHGRKIRAVDLTVAVEVARTVGARELVAAHVDGETDDALIAVEVEVSVEELDVIVDAAAGLRGSGCFGARMTGGGFGGSAIVLHEPSAAERVRDRIETDFLKRFDRRPRTMIVQASPGVRIEPRS